MRSPAPSEASSAALEQLARDEMADELRGDALELEREDLALDRERDLLGDGPGQLGMLRERAHEARAAPARRLDG